MAIDAEPPRIAFPCAYPIKVMGVNEPQLRDDVLDVFGRFAEIDPNEPITARESAAGRFVSLTVTITATGIEQIAMLHDRLREVPGVKLVL